MKFRKIFPVILMLCAVVFLLAGFAFRIMHWPGTQDLLTGAIAFGILAVLAFGRQLLRDKIARKG